MVGHLPGGLGHINVTVSMLFAGISGSSTADAAGIGSLLIPQMKKQGYDIQLLGRHHRLLLGHGRDHPAHRS